MLYLSRLCSKQIHSQYTQQKNLLHFLSKPELCMYSCQKEKKKKKKKKKGRHKKKIGKGRKNT